MTDHSATAYFPESGLGSKSLSERRQPRRRCRFSEGLHKIKEISCHDCFRENSLQRLLPNFSCHILRHTFATRLCESGVNIKVIQDVLGHADFDTTMNVYTDATKDFKQQEFRELDRLMSNGGSFEKSDE